MFLLSGCLRFRRMVLSLITKRLSKKVTHEPKENEEGNENSLALRLTVYRSKLILMYRARSCECGPWRACLSFTLHTLAIDDDTVGMHLPTIRSSKAKKPLLSVRKIFTMYSVRPGSCANLGETPGIGNSPPNQPISGLVIFSKYQALSRALVVNSNLWRGKGLARG